MVEFLAEPGSSAAHKLEEEFAFENNSLPAVCAHRHWPQDRSFIFSLPSRLIYAKKEVDNSLLRLVFAHSRSSPHHTPRRVAARFWDIAQVVLWSRWCCCAGVWLEFFVCFLLCILFALFYDSLSVSAAIPAASYTLSVQNFSVFQSSSSSKKTNPLPQEQVWWEVRHRFQNIYGAIVLLYDARCVLQGRKAIATVWELNQVTVTVIADVEQKWNDRQI